MSKEKLSMRKISEVMWLNQEQKLSVSAIAQSCNLARSTVSDYLMRFRSAGLTWPLPAEMGEDQLAHLLFPPVTTSAGDSEGRRMALPRKTGRD